MKKLTNLLFTAVLLMLFATTMNGQVPKKLAVYYGAPLNVNGQVPIYATDDSSDVTSIIDVFDDYDMIVFGQNLEDNLTGLDRTNFRNVVKGIKASSDPDPKEVFGYITLGENTVGLEQTEMERRVLRWKSLGVTGIFLDEAGYDYGVTRERQNDIVEYIHEQGMNVIMNAWIPSDVLSGEHKLDSDDYYMLESFMISSASPFGFLNAPLPGVGDRYASAKSLSTATNVKVVTLTTTNSPELGLSDCREAQLPYAWWATFAYGFDAMGWGEFNFSATSHQLPFRTRPRLNPQPNALIGNMTSNNGVLTQNTDHGLITINTNIHFVEIQHSSGNTISYPEKSPSSLEVGLCVAGGGRGQLGIYTQSTNKGISDPNCECYNLPCNKSSLGKYGDKWYLFSLPDCQQGAYITIEVNVGSNCDATELDCITPWN